MQLCDSCGFKFYPNHSAEFRCHYPGFGRVIFDGTGHAHADGLYSLPVCPPAIKKINLFALSNLWMTALDEI